MNINKKYTVSDHYNGDTFFNPTLSSQHLPGFTKALKMLWSTPKES